MTPRTETHITVIGNPLEWAAFCHRHEIKPLYIELSNGHRQLMCALSTSNKSEVLHELLTVSPAFEIVRVKDEVWSPPGYQHSGGVYYEAHYKFNGHMPFGGIGVSRDLFRWDRWYFTIRKAGPFTPPPAPLGLNDSTFVEVEYECCVLDTNPNLDMGWLQVTN